MKNFMNSLYLKAVCAMNSFKEEELGAVDVVVIVVMIGIAIALAIVFKDAASDLIDSLMTTITGNANDAVAVG